VETERAALVREAHETFDGLMRKAVGTAYRAGHIIPCGRGCFACCYEPVHATRQEAELLADALAAGPAEERARVGEAVREWVRRFDAAGLRKMKHMNVFGYRAAKLACPFLKGGECMAYADRPVACRGHVAVGEREQCEDDAKRGDQRFLLSDTMTAVPFAMIAEREDLEIEHLGLWLYELLFGERIVSASRKGLAVERE